MEIAVETCSWSLPYELQYGQESSLQDEKSTWWYAKSRGTIQQMETPNKRQKISLNKQEPKLYFLQVRPCASMFLMKSYPTVVMGLVSMLKIVIRIFSLARNVSLPHTWHLLPSPKSWKPRTLQSNSLILPNALSLLFYYSIVLCTLRI